MNYNKKYPTIKKDLLIIVLQRIVILLRVEVFAVSVQNAACDYRKTWFKVSSGNPSNIYLAYWRLFYSRFDDALLTKDKKIFRSYLCKLHWEKKLFGINKIVFSGSLREISLQQRKILLPKCLLLTYRGPRLKIKNLFFGSKKNS